MCLPYHLQERQKDESQVRFDDKCKTAEKLGLIHSFFNKEHEEVSLTNEIIEIYSYRNAIHLIAEQRIFVSTEGEIFGSDCNFPYNATITLGLNSVSRILPMNGTM